MLKTNIARVIPKRTKTQKELLVIRSLGKAKCTSYSLLPSWFFRGAGKRSGVFMLVRYMEGRGGGGSLRVLRSQGAFLTSLEHERFLPV